MFYIILYLLCITASNITANNLIDLGFVTFTIGTIFFAPIVTLRDKIQKIYTKNKVYQVIFIAVFINFVLSLFEAFDLRIVIASVIAMSVSEILDTEVYSKLKQKSWIFRVLSSNVVSIPLDSILFVVIAFYGILSASILISIIITQIVIKYCIASLIIIPLSGKKYE